MADKKISQLPVKGLPVSDNDLFEVSVFNGVDYDTFSVSGADVKAGLPATNVYNSDGTLAGNRNVDANGYQLQISNAGVFIVDGSYAPSGGNGTFTLNGYGTTSTDRVEKITSDSGVVRESFGDKSVQHYGSNGFNTIPNGNGWIMVDSTGAGISGILISGTTTPAIRADIPNASCFVGNGQIGVNINGSLYGVYTTSAAGGFGVYSGARAYIETFGLSGTAEPSAVLHVNSTTQGVLLPQLTTTQRDAISSPAVGLEIYNTTLGRKEVYSDFWGWVPLGSFTPDMGYDVFDDLFNATGSIWQQSSVNGGAINTISGASGILIGTTLTATNGGFLYRTNLTSVAFGSAIQRFESYIKIPINSSGTETFQYLSGFIDSQTTNQTNGAYFLYDAQGVSTGSTASGNWQCVTVKAGVRTFTTTTVTIDNTNFQKLRIDVNSSGTEVKFYIAGVLVATHTTNVPTANMGSGNYIQKSAGTTARTFQLDFVRYKTKYNTAR